MYFSLALSFSFFGLPFPPGILCPVTSNTWCLLFFSCNQTHRFISVTLRHHLNQFSGTFPSCRATIRVGTLQSGTHLCMHSHMPSVSLTHTLAKAQTGTYEMHTGANRLSGDSPHHCSLMSYWLHLYSIHLSLLTSPGNSLYPLYLYPHSVSPCSDLLSPLSSVFFEL